YDEAENFDNQLRSTLTVRHMSAKGPSSEEKVVSFQHVAPGYYQARASLSDFGAYALKAVHHRVAAEQPARPAGVSFASVTRPYPEEFSDLTPRPETLARIAEVGGGKFSPSPSELWDPEGDTVTKRVGRQNDFILLAILLFLLDLLLRRVRLFDREFRASA